MAFAFFAVTILLTFPYSCVSTSYPEQKPALQEYQNLFSIVPLVETWYVVYRNYEVDPFFGSSTGCLRFSQANPGQESDNRVVFQQNPNVSGVARVTFSSSPGYTVENILNFHPLGYNASVSAYSAYNDDKCAVLRLPYAAADACALAVPKSQLERENTCCDFIFDLLCGATKRVKMFDGSCP